MWDPVRNSVNPESVAAMVEDVNITLTSLIIICNYIIYAFGKRAIIPEEAVHNLGTWYMEAEYRAYEYGKEKVTEKDNIEFWYRQPHYILTSLALLQTNECSCHFSASPPIVTPIASPIFVYLCPPSNTEYIRHLIRTG